MSSQTYLDVHDPPKFDLETYVANYEGPTRLDRLIFIGKHSRYLSAEAFRAAITEAKRGRNVPKFGEITQHIHKLRPDDALGKTDTEWAESKQRQVTAEADRLEHELKGYKNNLIKESIRMGNEDLGAFYYEIGDMPSSFKAYSRMREYCTTPKHHAELNLKLILVCIAQENWLAVQSSAYKIQGLNLPDPEKPRIMPVTQPVLGLSHMNTGNYRAATTAFLATDTTFLALDAASANGSTSTALRFPRTVLSGNDIAVYGGLCALATLSRLELQTLVLENASFRQFLELEPHLRRAIAAFCASKYTACLGVLKSYEPDWRLDLHLARHVTALYSMIRRKCLVEFFAPFSCVSFDAIAEAFPPTSPDLSTQAELEALIRDGALDARIDAVQRTLVSPTRNARQDLYEGALRAAREQEKALRLRLFRANCLEKGWEVRGPKQPQQPMPGMEMGEGGNSGYRTAGLGATGMGMGGDGGERRRRGERERRG